MLGMIASGYLSLNDLEIFITEVKNQLNAEAIFGVNLFIKAYLDKPNFLPTSKEILKAEELNFTVPKNIAEKDYIALLIKHKVQIVSTTFGILSKESITLLQKYNIEIIATVTSIAEAQLAINKNIHLLYFKVLKLEVIKPPSSTMN
ncbi:MAG: NAD(P)H-dependent flavin oxidoreductase YrpB (nitropropane dioxygenase family) [Francisella sp.]|jgi:NAD(P)H-dependent flavin oxidoreductase YrpB (nitropropane dioxygenase family)